MTQPSFKKVLPKVSLIALFLVETLITLFSHVDSIESMRAVCESMSQIEYFLKTKFLDENTIALNSSGSL